MPEKTLLLIKPDGVARGLEQEILNRIKQAGFQVARSKHWRVSAEQARDLYSPHLGKPFYDGLIKFITSGDIIAIIVDGEKAIEGVRAIMGATDPGEALPGTIRGDLREANYRTAEGTIKNLVHGSDSLESAKRESAIFFGEESA